jgi:hypothetical protein
MNPMEMLLAVVMAALAAGVATSYIQVPTELTSSSVAVAFMLIVVLGMFSYSPVVGIAGMILLAVLIFNRNVARFSTYTQAVRAENPRRGEYADMHIAKERVDMMPYASTASGPRDYAQFRETTPGGWMPLSEGFTTEQTAYSSFGSEQYANGQYPLENQRQWSNPYMEEVKFRPSLDTGNNEFQRYGPDMDEKRVPLAYQ